MRTCLARYRRARLEKRRQRKYREAMGANKLGDRELQATRYAEAAAIEEQLQRLESEGPDR